MAIRILPDTIQGMDEAAILRQLDAERQTVADSDSRLERTSHVVRAFGVGNRWAGIVYSRFSPPETAAIVDGEISFFTALSQDFEWKVYSHDEPPELLAQLRKRGFRVGEEEALMIRDLREFSPFLLASPPAGLTVSPVKDERRIEDYLFVESAVWSCEPDKTRELLHSTLGDSLQRDLAFVAYSDRKPAGCGRVTAPPNSQFCGLWGGSVLPESRGRGIYRALLSARIEHVRQFDSIRYLRVDAMPMSRPILEKYGFKRVASTWPAEWSPGK
jgi:GNAT superfamily N-acetyltransferase